MNSEAPLIRASDASVLCRLFLVVAALCVPLYAATAETAGAASEASLPVRPAVRAAHASQAMLLAAMRAGSRIVAVGDHGVVMLSDDDGRSHRQARRVPVDVVLTAVHFASEREGWAVGHRGVVLHTADAGETWALQRIDDSGDRPLFAVHFFDARNGVAVGLWSRVIVTSDGGAHWDTVAMQPPEGSKKADLNLMALAADDKGRLYAAGERGMVLRSEDRGRTWVYEATGYKGSFWASLAAPDGVLLVGGLRGSLYRSTDGGRSWSRVETHSRSSITSLAVVGPAIVGVGLEGLVLRSDDNGLSFKASVCPERLDLTAVEGSARRQPIVYSRRGIATLRCDAGVQPETRPCACELTP